MLSLPLEESLDQTLLGVYEEIIEIDATETRFLSDLQWDLEIDLTPLPKNSPLDAIVKNYKTISSLSTLCNIVEICSRQFKTLHLKNVSEDLCEVIMHVLQAQAKKDVSLTSVVITRIDDFGIETNQYVVPQYQEIFSEVDFDEDELLNEIAEIEVQQSHQLSPPPLFIRTQTDNSTYSHDSASSSQSEYPISSPITPEDDELSASFSQWPKSPLSQSETKLEKLTRSLPNLRVNEELAKYNAYGLFRQQLKTQVDKEKLHNSYLSPQQVSSTRSCTDVFFQKTAIPKRTVQQTVKERNLWSDILQPKQMSRK